MSNDFIKNLQSQVKGNSTAEKMEKAEDVTRLSKKEYVERELKKAIEERKRGNAISDPKADKRFEKEMRKSLEEAYDALKAHEVEEKKAKAREVEKSHEEKGASKKESSLRDINGKDIGYLDRVALLHEMKMKMLKEQRDKGDYTPSTKEAYKIMLLEASVERDREKYMESLEPEEIASVIKLEEAYKNKELDVVREQNNDFREKVHEMSELNKKLKDINDCFEELQEKMRNGEISEEDYRKEMAEKQLELDETLADINELNPEKLQEAIYEKQRQSRLQRAVLGKDYSEKVFVRSSDEMRERLNYASEKNAYNAAAIMTENKYLQKQGLERTIEEYEKHKEKLEKELEKLEDTPDNLERRTEILKELRITDAKLDGYNNTKDDLEHGLERDKDVRVDMEEESKAVEEDIKEVEEEFEPIEEVLEKSEELDFDFDHARADAEHDIREQAFKTGVKTAVAVKVLDDCPRDTEHAVIAGVVAGKMKENSLRNEWENAVSKEYNEEDVRTKQERDAAIREELEEQEQTYERARTITRRS